MLIRLLKMLVSFGIPFGIFMGFIQIVLPPDDPQPWLRGLWFG